MATKQEVCPVVGTTNTILPPSHPEFDLSKPGQVCPVTNATTDHHQTLHKHPAIETTAANKNHLDMNLSDAAACPALASMVEKPEQQKMDEAVCPVVGPVSATLPPDHPSTADNKEGDVCPVTKATLGHHKGKVTQHPRVDNAAGVCPVVGKSAA